MARRALQQMAGVTGGRAVILSPAPPKHTIHMSKSSLPSLAHLIIPGTYKHYKGGEYRVIGAAYLEATLEQMVVYQQCASGEMFVRPFAQFTELVEGEAGLVPRFALVEPATLIPRS